MVHRKLKSLPSLRKHIRIDIKHLNRRLAIIILLPRMVQNPQRNVARSTSDVQTPQWTSSTWVKLAHEGVLPESVHSERHRVVHDVVLACDTTEDAPNEVFLNVGIYRSETEVGCRFRAGRAGAWTGVRSSTGTRARCRLLREVPCITTRAKN